MVKYGCGMKYIHKKGLKHMDREYDMLSADGIMKYLDGEGKGLKLQVLSETESTNNLLKAEAVRGAVEGTIIAANSQTKGKGRLGRSFYSPADTGVYLSILLRPHKMPPEDAVMITTMAAVAASEAVDAVSGQKTGIKWVNDIILNGKKIAGILTEAAFSSEGKTLEYAVMGIGFNAYEPEGGFPENIKNIAGAIFEEKKKDNKNMLAAEFIKRFMLYYKEGKKSGYSEKYREKSLVIGKEISVITAEGGRKARALDVDDACHLLVEYEDGSRENLSTGEISIRFDMKKY